MRKPSLGQHFLIDPTVLQRIVEAGEINELDTVVEVGPGKGVLTRELVARAKSVMAIEIDSTLARNLSGELNNPTNLTVLCEDARTYGFDTDSSLSESYKVVANLPYYAASLIVRRFLESAIKPSLMVVTLQKEVAEAMVAKPGRMSILSVGTQFFGIPRIVCTVMPSAFRPSPRVTSAVVRIDVRSRPAVNVTNIVDFFAVVHAGFAAPRKQIRNSLALGIGFSASEAEQLLTAAGIDHQRRPSTLCIFEWAHLYHTYLDRQTGI
ncbi:ribosomal RNA small subunit methyltransferase A [SAR202 cluster bacterium AD-804-J14_MRT_500m]|nr:ribosomal RNA small subunit methyltransferase A [SAR202 cluster bacterium AD-804-J14_MRT_500m]